MDTGARDNRLFDTARFERDGYALVEGVIDGATLDTLGGAVDKALPRGGRRRDGCGMRHLLRDVALARLVAASEPMLRLARAALGAEAFPVRGLWFDKTADANWHVGWHQDQTIAVDERVDDAPGYGPWSQRDGVIHVRPPVDVLAGMVTLRLHLDDCGADNGPLRVIPGTHRAGWLDADEIAQRRQRGACGEESGPVDCCVRRGGVLVMRPLLVHASSPAQRPGHRRVGHFEYAAAEPPGGLRWRAC